MVKRLTQHGNSAALIIDKPVLDLLKITMDTPLEIATDGRNLIVSPIRSVRREQRFRSALEAVNRRTGKPWRLTNNRCRGGPSILNTCPK